VAISESRLRIRSRPVAQVLAVASFSAAAVSPRPLIAASAGVIGVAILALSIWRTDGANSGIGNTGIWAGAAGVAVVLIGQYQTVGPVPQSALDVRQLWVGLLALACVSTALATRTAMFRRVAMAAGLASVLLITGVMVASDWDSSGGVDVYRNHQAAGDALLDGENPYGEAVQVENGSPFVPEGTMIVGYSYPPVILATYGLVATFTDPRIVSLLAWLGVLVWLALRSRRSDESGLKHSMLVLLATAPVWPVVWFIGWTEPLSLAFLLVAAVLWTERPIASAVALGLALASKQYFVFLAPVLLLYEDEERWKRTSIALGVAAATLVPALLVDASAFITANVGNLADIGFRPDTQSLSGALAELGLDFYLPVAAWVLLSLAFASLVGRGSKTRADFFLRSTLALGFSFLIGQAFPNYWYLLLGMVAIAAVLKKDESDRSARSAAVVRSAAA